MNCSTGGYSHLPQRGKSGNQRITLSHQGITDGREPTRERIISEAMRLFAERGYRGTTVGDIEEAAGLAPRAGGLYKHFASKDEVVTAGIERHVAEIEAMHSAMDVMPLGDVRAELTLIARWALHELRSEQNMMKIVFRDGDQFPQLVELFSERIVNRGYREAATVIGRIFENAGVHDRDPNAIAAIALGSLVHYRIEETMFGRPPAGVEEDEFVETWVEVWTRIADSGEVRNAMSA
jgi:AcrR family transcriptional regulator